MTPLRKLMIEAMQQRGFSERTHQTYLSSVSDLAHYYNRSPDQITVDEMREYFKHLVLERKLAPESCRLYRNGIRFFYLHVLNWSSFDVPITLPKKRQKIPELLTRKEVSRLLIACDNPKHRMLLTLCYGCGLRVSELVKVQITHIDGERSLLRVEQGKGNKDRMVIIAPSLLKQLREHWKHFRSPKWLFPSAWGWEEHISVTAAQRIFGKAKRRSGIKKQGGIHSLRHAYATHQLEQGLPIYHLQKMLGHTDMRTTLRYLHWVPNADGNSGSYGDLTGMLEVSHE